MTYRFLPLALAAIFALAPGLAAAPATKKKPAPSRAPAAAAPPRPQPAPALPAEVEGGVPEIQAAAAIVVDAQTGAVLHEVNADSPRPVASTQKLLTALLVAEEGDLQRSVRVEASDTWCEPSMLYIKPGENYSRSKLLQILLVKSMNDVARCLARDNAGSLDAFAAKMNAKAAQLGMTSSRFVNPNGLPAPGQFSTARDMARVAYIAYRNRTIRNFVNMKGMTWQYNDGRVKTFETTNRVLKKYPFCNGMKTGYTEASGFCLISSGASGGRDVIVVVLGAKREAIWTDSYRLLAWGLTS